MTSKYKKVVVKQIVTELDLLITFYHLYKHDKDPDWIQGIFEGIENLEVFQEIWKDKINSPSIIDKERSRHQLEQELDNHYDSEEIKAVIKGDIKEEIVEEEEE